MAPAPAPGAGGNPRRVSRAELVKRWEDVLDDDGDKDMELFMTQLLRDARKEEGEEEEQRRARVFEPWHPPQPGSALPPPVAAVAPRVERTAVLGLRAPPHLMPRNGERTTPTPPSAPTPADLGRSVKPAAKNSRGGV